MRSFSHSFEPVPTSELLSALSLRRRTPHIREVSARGVSSPYSVFRAVTHSPFLFFCEIILFALHMADQYVGYEEYCHGMLNWWVLDVLQSSL
jgi:hypothetical protein